MGTTCSRIFDSDRQLPGTKKKRRRTKVKSRKAEKRARKLVSSVSTVLSPRTPSIPKLASTEKISDGGRADERQHQINNERAENQYEKMAEMNNKNTECLEIKTAKEAKETDDHGKKIRPTPAPRSKRDKFRPTPVPRPRKFHGTDKDDIVIVEIEDDTARNVDPPINQHFSASMTIAEPEKPPKLSLTKNGDTSYPAYRFFQKEKGVHVPDTVVPEVKSKISIPYVGANRDTDCITPETGGKIIGSTKISPEQASNREDSAVYTKATTTRVASLTGWTKPVDKNPRNKAVGASAPRHDNQSSTEGICSRYLIDNPVDCRFTHTNISTNRMRAYETRVIGTRITSRGPLDTVSRAAYMDAYISGKDSINRDPFSPWRNDAGYIQDARVLSYNAGMISRTRPGDMVNDPLALVNRQTIAEFDAVQAAEGEGVTSQGRNHNIRNARGVGPISRQVDPNRPVMSTLNDDRQRMRYQRPNLIGPGLPTPMSECLDHFAERYTRRTSPNPRP